ncbi:MAG: amino acid permease [Acidobacteria bacterium]|nr:amino acid permease [Acidobacteriota bacterium]MBU1473986.1 amino acid permease [Acidobacteriota bacterium]MBU2438868.1 amino acid permease [Acidobacteriota bacterium]
MKQPAAGISPKEEQPSDLPRVLTLWDIVGIVVGGVIGSGIFIVPAAIASNVTSPLLILAVWVTGGILSFFGALAFSELGAAYPQAGGSYVYLREAYGPLVSFLFGWTLFLVIDTGAIATLAVAFSSIYLPHFFTMTPQVQKLIAVVFVLALVSINYVGVRWGANVQNLLTAIKFTALGGICFVLLVFGKGNTANFVSPAPESFSWGLVGSFGVAVVAVLWAYKGWEAATYSAGETKNPGKNLPLGLFIGIVSVIGIYIVTNLAYLYLFPAEKIAQSERVASDAMSLIIGPIGASIVAALILISMTGAANQILLTSPRVYYAMAHDGLFFNKLKSVHRRFLTPHLAIVTMGVWSIILSVSGTFEQLFTYVVFGQWIFFGMTAGAVFILRKKRPDLPRPYKTFGYPVTPFLFILAALFISFNTLINEFLNALAGLAIIALGLPAFLYWRKKSISKTET